MAKEMGKTMEGHPSIWTEDDGRCALVKQGVSTTIDRELDMNFQGGADDEDEEDVFYDVEEEEEPLYPGLYKALYAFEPEGTAEMALKEDQVVRVVGRGGGVGWAVVIDEREGMPDKHALVPESYLEAVRLDWENEGEND